MTKSFTHDLIFLITLTMTGKLAWRTDTGNGTGGEKTQTGKDDVLFVRGAVS